MILVRVSALPTPLYTAEEYTANLQQVWDEISKEAQEYLEEKVRELRKDGVERVSSVSVEGFAAEKIIDFARQRPDSLVTMCTHGRTGVGRFVLGSVTDRVVRHGGDPVLVVRAMSGRSAS